MRYFILAIMVFAYVVFANRRRRQAALESLTAQAFRNTKFKSFPPILKEKTPRKFDVQKVIRSDLPNIGRNDAAHLLSYGIPRKAIALQKVEFVTSVQTKIIPFYAFVDMKNKIKLVMGAVTFSFGAAIDLEENWKNITGSNCYQGNDEFHVLIDPKTGRHIIYESVVDFNSGVEGLY